MKENADIEIRRTMESMDGLDRAKPRPFFYGRLKSRMDQQTGTAHSIIYRWKYQTAAAILILLMNFTVIYHSFQDESIPYDEMDHLVEEYGMNTSYYDLTEE
jgi:hypothetical protein